PLAWGWLFVTSGALFQSELKAIFARARPHFAEPFVVESSWSFPSGHAMGSLIGYGLLAYLLAQVVRPLWARVAVVGTATLLVAAIGFSRLYLGAHYFSDVVGGYAAGAAWLCACISAGEWVRRHRYFTPALELPSTSWSSVAAARPDAA